MEKKPFVSVVIPIRNEEKYLKNCLNSLINQDYGLENFEIVIVDGISDDNTIQIVEEFKEKYTNIKLFFNEKKVTPFAMTIGVQKSIGEIVVMVIGHSIFPKNFITSGIKLFEKYPDASCVGGPITSIGENSFAVATSLAMSSKIGIGNANHRFPGYEGRSEMACFPFYKREVYEALGYYDEKFIRNQDDEFAFRVTKSNRYIYISPTVNSEYIVRNTPKKLFKQYFGYGYYKWIGYLKHKSFISFRHLIPALFVLFNLGTAIFSIISENFLFFLLPLLLYFVIIVIYSFKLKTKKLIKIQFIIAVIILHFSYGIGFINSFIKNRKY